METAKQHSATRHSMKQDKDKYIILGYFLYLLAWGNHLKQIWMLKMFARIKISSKFQLKNANTLKLHYFLCA